MIKKRVIAVVFMLLFMLLLSLSCAKPSLLPAQAPSQTPVLTTGAADQKTDLGEEQTATANAAARAMSSNETEMALRSTKAAIATADQATQSQLSIEASKTAVEANRQGTQLAKAQTATQNVVSTAQSYKSTSDALEGRMTLKFGPKNGNLLHIPTNNTVEWYVVSISVADFVMEARFFNPDAPKWDYGFAFRRGGTNNQFRFWIRSDKHWYLTYTTGNMADKKNVADGKVPNLNTGAGKSNLVRIVADGETGMLMVNGEWVARFSLADRTGPGGIYIATGFSRGDETKGQLTHYEEFTIWDLK